MSFYTRNDFLIYLTENNISTMPEFRKKNPAMHLWYTRHKAVIGELPLTPGKRSHTTLTEEYCFNIAKQYQYRSDLQAKDKGVYLKLLRTGKLDEACAHMITKPVNYQTDYVKNKLIGKPAVNRSDLSDKVFNKWYVVGPSPNQGTKKLYWTCHCLGCALIYEVSGSNLKSGKSKQCPVCAKKQMAKTNTGKVKTKRTPKESSEYYFFMRERGRSLRWKRDWELTLEDTTKLIYGNCTYCGTEPNTKSNLLRNHGLSQKHTDEAIIIRNGIDRIDSSKGYVHGNVTTCCHTCNKMKSNMSIEDFKTHILKLVKHLGL